jgi:hypothetical protein
MLPYAGIAEEIITGTPISLIGGNINAYTIKGRAYEAINYGSGYYAPLPFDSPLYTDLVRPFTLAAVINPADFKNYGYLFNLNPTTGTPADPWLVITLQVENGDSGRAAYVVGGSAESSTTAPGYITLDVQSTLSYSRTTDGATLHFYKDGGLFGSAGGMNTGVIDVGSHGYPTVYNRSHLGSGYDGKGRNNTVALWSRELTAKEHADYHANPYAMLTETNKYWRLAAAPTGPIDVQLVASLDGDSSLSATLTVAPPVDNNITAALDGDSSLDATLTIEAGAVVNLTSALPGDSSIAATVTIQSPVDNNIAAALSGDSSVDATLTTEAGPVANLTSALDGDSSISATITIQAPVDNNISATLDGDSSIVANVGKEAPGFVDLVSALDGDSSITADVTITLPVDHNITASLLGDSGGEGFLVPVQPGQVLMMAALDGDAEIVASVGIDLPVDAPIAAALDGDSSISGSLTTQAPVDKPITATVSGDSSLAAQLFVAAPGDVLVQAVLNAEATLSADLVPVVVSLPTICNPSVESCTPIRTVQGGGGSTVT